MSLCIIYFTGYSIFRVYLGKTMLLLVSIMPTTLQVTMVWVDLHGTYQLEQRYSTPNIEE